MSYHCGLCGRSWNVVDGDSVLSDGEDPDAGDWCEWCEFGSKGREEFDAWSEEDLREDREEGE